jgi:hypothetical protein
MDLSSAESTAGDRASRVYWLALIGLVAGSMPVVFRFSPLPTRDFFIAHAGLAVGSGIILLALMSGIAYVLYQRSTIAMPERRGTFIATALLALALSVVHLLMRDLQHFAWQADQYLGILAQDYPPPHLYRFLPQGIVWYTALFTGRLFPAAVVYRVFFTWTLCLALYRFARLFLNPKWSGVVLAIYAAFYPWSIRYYYGNWCDPVFHTLFLLGLRYCFERRFHHFLAALLVGMFAKETILVLGPCYALAGTRALREISWGPVARAALATAAGLALFVLIRVAFGFDFTQRAVNGAPGLMVLPNLGVLDAATREHVGVFSLYAHPIAFLFAWFPAIFALRRAIPGGLASVAIYLALAVFGTNLLFGWNFESRNFIPVTAVLATAVIAGWQRQASEDSHRR